MKKHILLALKEELAGYTEEQWKELDEKTKKEYIKDHPHSKYAQQDNPVKPEKSKEYDDGSMTSKEAKEYWKNYHDSDPVLEMYDSFEEWYKESKQNGYIIDEDEEIVEKEKYPYSDDKMARYTDYFGKKEKTVDRPTSIFDGELEIESWDDQPDGGYCADEASYIGRGIQDAVGSNKLDVKYADAGTSNFVSVLDKETGKMYNIVIDEYAIDVMNKDMTDSYCVGEVENGYFEPDKLEDVVQFLKKNITGNSSTYDAGHAEEWMERHPHGYYNSEDDYGIDSDDKYDEANGIMTTEEAKEYWKENHDSDPILEEYDSFKDWYRESKLNGYIKD